MDDKKKFYITSNYALTGYLEVKGLKYIKAELSKNTKGQVKVDFVFLDPDNKGQDLEMEFRFSDEKKYRDSLFFFRKVINDLLGK